MTRRFTLSTLACLFLFSQVHAEDTKTMEKKYFEFWKPHAGVWDLTLQEEGKEDVKLLATYRPSITELAYVSRGMIDGTLAGNGLHGYDPVQKCWLDLMFHKVGESSMFVTQHLKADVDEGLSKGAIVKMEGVQVIDGEVVKFTCIREYTVFQRNKIVFVNRDKVTSDGKKLPNMTAIWMKRPNSKVKHDAR